jgi:chromosome partitioning protein
MFVTVANFKGGVAKTTTAVHLATYFQKLGPTLLIDGDPNRSATAWAKRGSMPFTIVDEAQGAYKARQFEHVIIDTQARPERDDLVELAKGCDLLIIPTVPSALDYDALALTLAAVQKIAPDRYRVLLTKVPPPPRTDAKELRAMLEEQKIPLFDAEIPLLVAFEKAAAEGIPVSAVKNDQRAERAWKAYQSIGEQLTNGKK